MIVDSSSAVHSEPGALPPTPPIDVTNGTPETPEDDPDEAETQLVAEFELFDVLSADEARRILELAYHGAVGAGYVTPEDVERAQAEHLFRVTREGAER